MTVNRERVEAWCEALESGEYEWGTGYGSYVGMGYKHCAWGVGRVVAQKNGWDYTWSHLDLDPDGWSYNSLRGWYGLPGYRLFTKLKPDGVGLDDIVGANDVSHQDHWTIAQRIRETYLKDD